ncbi:hypothetical protein CM19_03185 [Candidatus Acidianus copahuensis]|uniref:Uncharacterized protein n=2 Tax=Sulfolobaceae TaxID=118883 RepID=A0A031LTR7_9CREN|nr:hypothetical protein CM19_03185 [Candidatus Acidianus copahuensis]
MSLGYTVSQKKKVVIGNHVITFKRRKRGEEYLYIVEEYFMGKLTRRGIFSEYSNAVMYAGNIIYALL